MFNLLSSSDSQAFVVALYEVRVVTGPRINLQFWVDDEQERLACSVKGLADANFTGRNGSEYLLIRK